MLLLLTNTNPAALQGIDQSVSWNWRNQSSLSALFPLLGCHKQTWIQMKKDDLAVSSVFSFIYDIDYRVVVIWFIIVYLFIIIELLSPEVCVPDSHFRSVYIIDSICLSVYIIDSICLSLSICLDYRFSLSFYMSIVYIIDCIFLSVYLSIL